MSKENKTYFVYLTDLFCGDLNYSWVTKLRVSAKSLHGVLCKVSALTGLNFRQYVEGEIYHSKSKLTALVIEHDEEYLQYDYSSAEEI